MKNNKRKIERFLLAIVSTLVIIMAWIYNHDVKPELEFAQKSYTGDSIAMVNLASPLNEEAFRKIFKEGDYVSDPVYVDFLVAQLKEKLSKQSLPNLGALNKKSMMIDASLLAQAGDLGKERLKISQYNLGLDSILVAQETSTAPPSYPSIVAVGKIESGISFHGKVTTAKNKEKNTKSKPIAGLLMQLTQEFSQSYKDSIISKTIASTSEDSLRVMDLDNIVISPFFYARTDAKGQYEFKNLEKGKNYSITPLKPGKEYGSLQGSANVLPCGTLDKVKSSFGKNKYKFDFAEREHTVRLLDNSTYLKIKNDKIFTVRTPEEFSKDFVKYISLFLLSFWLLHFVLSIRKYDSDAYILPIILFLSGTGLIVLFSIQNPSRDEVYGSSMAIYTALSMLALSLITLLSTPQKLFKILSFDYATNLHERGVKLPKLFKKHNDVNLKSRGYLWLFLSIGLLILLLFFGSGPEGSGVKVNLGPIQVSEISKYLMIIFFAKYFTANLEYFKKIPSNKWLLKHNFKMLIFFALLIIIYVALGDLGPALVICTMFLVFYSFAKKEFLNMAGAAVVYGILLYIVYSLFSGDSNIVALFSLLVCLGLGGYTFFLRKKDESSFFLITLISAFSILEIIPFSQFARLKDRNGMFHNIWNNDLHGGDQIAQGVWSLASGGWTGQGLGNGYSNVMPAYHTDMIFQSIGEELGLIALVSILIAFALLLFRSMLAARKTGKTLLFYFISGVALSTVIQLGIIIGGSLGLIPLTGISVPFLSKGNSSLLINIFFFGIVILLSGINATKREAEHINKRFDSVNAYSILAFMAIMFVFCFRLVYLQLTSDENMIKPALVLSKQGEWQYSVNPRIKIIGKELKAGSIYDRNGKLLATSDKAQFLKEEPSLNLLDNNSRALFSKQKYSRQSRYYPYGEDLIFWLGDVNNQLVTTEQLGYVAEFRHYSDLRGLNAAGTTETFNTDEYKESKFLPEEQRSTNLTSYNYSDYIPFLKAGKNSNVIKKHNENAENRTIKLSLDVDLFQEISAVINTPEYKNYLVSVVAIKTDDGQVLASASNPKPSYKDLHQLRQFDPRYYNKLMNTYFGYNQYVADRDLALFRKTSPGSTAKVLDAMACLNRFGKDSASIKYFVTQPEIIDTEHGEPVIFPKKRNI